MKIALTGSTGILGSCIKKYCVENEISCYSLDRSIYSSKASKNELINFLRKKNVSFFFHCAANTNVDKCEEFPETCLEDNYYLTKRLGEICNSLRIKFVFISSTGVYGDLKTTPHTELDELSPTTCHHKSKVLAEKALQSMMENCLIIRTGWLFGGDWGARKNFVANRVRDIQKNSGPMKSDTSQFGCPTYVLDVTNCIFLLINRNERGIFNCVNKGNASRYEYVKEIIKLANFDIEIIAADGHEFKRIANVARNEMASNGRLSQIGIDFMPHWRKSLANYIKLHKGDIQNY
jgi:dTDP-4-dehydrorhamnose reductase